ncbi:4Fe-4S single cluster domain-containing protein [Ornatilinea apprima]|uniref:4Fe-4S single cluster domain-containing protein n=1 Tax=Ornatilinea apprima TaxID=1134406 RepID=UPI0009466116|nr:4Fe-4S single cluster domain-containing protein [Ornatilinea apprima]
MIRVNKIINSSLVDGPGERTVVFFQGCSIRCPGCQNVALWDPNSGDLYDEQDLARKLAHLAQPHGNVTISGGEPFNQVRGLAFLVRELKHLGVKNIQVYSGYTFEQLIAGTNGSYLWVREVLDQIDVLVDGPFIQALDDPFITYRGSRNQRPIDVQLTLKSAPGSPVVLNWDDEIQISQDGNIVLPIGLSKQFDSIGTIERSRMCGQTTLVR